MLMCPCPCLCPLGRRHARQSAQVSSQQSQQTADIVQRAAASRGR
jgi:hypothetical protein